MYKALIFDLDGTLINSLPYHFLAFKEILLEHNIRVKDAYLRRLIGMPTLAILRELKQGYGFRENIEDLREERRYHYFKFMGMRNLLFPGVKRTLSKLRLSYKLALATGSSRVIFLHSTDKDFQGLFDVVSTINDVRRGKPSPEQFVKVANKLRVQLGDCLSIGDSSYDAMASKRAGMDFVGVTTGFTKTGQLKPLGPVAIIDSVNRLPSFLARFK